MFLLRRGKALVFKAPKQYNTYQKLSKIPIILHNIQNTASVFTRNMLLFGSTLYSIYFSMEQAQRNIVSFCMSFFFILFLRYNFFYISFTVNRYNRSIFHKIHIMPFIIYLSQYYELN